MAASSSAQGEETLQEKIIGLKVTNPASIKTAFNKKDKLLIFPLLDFRPEIF